MAILSVADYIPSTKVMDAAALLHNKPMDWVEGTQECILVLDSCGAILALNQAAERILGKTSDAVSGQPLSAIHPQLARQISRRNDEADFVHEIRLDEADESRVFEISVSRLSAGNEQNAHQIAVLRNVTERIQQEAQLRTSEAYYRVLTENSTDIIIIVSGDGTILYVSSALERILGRTSAEVVSTNALEFFHPEDGDKLMASLAESLQAANISSAFSARIRNQAGQWRVLECVANNLLDNSALKGIVINARDITERAEAEAALRDSEERYRLHFSNVGDVIFSCDTRLNLQTASPSFERHLGYKPEELVGRSLLELPFWMPDQREPVRMFFQDILGGTTVAHQQQQLFSRCGTAKTVEISGNPVSREGQIIGVICVARDITERKKAEDQVKASLQEKEILLKEIHHRVKNNLQIICSLLNLQSNTIDDPQSLAQFQDSQNRIRSMALIHERLYRSNDLGRIDFGAYLSDLAASLVQAYRRQAQNTRLAVKADSVMLDIDTAIPCGLIVNELVSNALKHAFPDGRTGTVGVELRDDPAAEHYSLVVWDDGVGIAADRIDQFTSSLGLQLVHSLAHQLDGTVELGSGSGTRLEIKFARRSVKEV